MTKSGTGDTSSNWEGNRGVSWMTRASEEQSAARPRNPQAHEFSKKGSRGISNQPQGSGGAV